MNAWDRRSETCTSESGCATSADKSSSEEKNKNAESKNENVKSSTSSIQGVSAIATSNESNGPWTYSEHCACMFLHGLYAHGNDWKLIAAYVHSRKAEEVQHYFHSFQKEEPFLSTLRRMLDDQSLVHIIAWQPGGRTFRIYNTLTFMRIPVFLYFGEFFLDFDHFQRALYTHGFQQNMYNGVWFHPHFWREFSLELKQQDSNANDRLSSTSTPNNSDDKNTQVISESSNQRKVKAVTTSKSKITSKKEIKKNTGAWSTTEHCLFLEGLEQHGRSWHNIASHVKTRTALQVSNHANAHLKKINCYWTTKEHQLFLEGLQQYERGHWVEIATHVGTKNKEQVSLHANEYFKKEEKMNGKSQKMGNSVEDSVGIMKTNTGEWSAEEHNRFLEGLEQHGRSWKDVASHVVDHGKTLLLK